MGKTWEKPKLIVLVRGKPEEAVLASCKKTPAGIGNPSAVQTNCRRTTGVASCGGTCSEISAT